MLITLSRRLWPAILLTLVACGPARQAQDAAPANPASRTARDQPPSSPNVNPVEPETHSGTDWLPLHQRPRSGDYAIHYRLLPDGLSRQQRRTEVMRISRRQITVKRIYGDNAGQPLRVVQLKLNRAGKVISEQILAGSAHQPFSQQGRARLTHVAPPEPLHLISGRYSIDQILSRPSATAGTAVYYLDAQVPFREVVSLTTHRTGNHARMIKLLGHIAIPTSNDATSKSARPDNGIRSGWVLMHWGRGER